MISFWLHNELFSQTACPAKEYTKPTPESILAILEECFPDLDRWKIHHVLNDKAFQLAYTDVYRELLCVILYVKASHFYKVFYSKPWYNYIELIQFPRPAMERKPYRDHIK